MKIINPLIFALIIITLFSCKKEETLPIYGKWTRDDDTVSNRAKHLIIDQNNNVFFLGEKDYGFRYLDSHYSCVISETQILSIYLGVDYQIHNNKLILTDYPPNDPTTPIITRYIRNENALEASEWIKSINPTETMDCPFIVIGTGYHTGTIDLASKDNYIWFTDGNYPSQLYKMDINSLTIEPSTSLNLEAKGIEWVDGNLWVTDTTKRIYRVDFNTGESVEESSDINDNIIGMCYDGGDFWCVSLIDYQSGAITVLNKYSNVRTHLYETSFSNPTGVTCVGEYVYVCSDGILNKCTKNPFRVVESYDVLYDNGSIRGVTTIDDNIWVSVWYPFEQKIKIELIEL